MGGTDPNVRDPQEMLFVISSTWGGYPQFFVMTLELLLGDCGGSGDSNGGRHDIIEYFRNFNRMKMLNKTSSLPLEVLVMHPELLMWEDIRFGVTAAAPPLPPP